jgi:hypothetical protein
MSTVKQVTLQLFAKTAEAQAELDAIMARAKELGDLNPTIRPKIDKAAATAGLAVLRRDMKDAGRDANTLSGSISDVGKNAAKAGGASGIGALVGAGGGSGMGALIGAATALVTPITTIAFGLAGFGLAAYGAAKPILNAAQATGGLAANMSKLNPEQQKVARGLLGLGHQFGAFEKQLQPQVLGFFNEGIRLAGHLLGDVQPVAKATGTALGGLLGEIDKEFQSGTWQQFFTFMARTAGPDIQLLGKTFLNLAGAMPPLLEVLQPVANDFLDITSALSKLIGVAAAYQQSLDKTAQHEHGLAAITDGLRKLLFDPGFGLSQALHLLHLASGESSHSLNLAAISAALAGKDMKAAGPKAWSLNTAVAALNTSMTALVGNLLTLQGSDVSWQQSLQAAKKQLDSNTAGLAGNSRNALANKQAVIAASNAAISFADQQLTLGKNLGGASRTIQDQIRWLQGLHDKSRFVRDEIKALRLEEQKLQAQRVNQKISVRGLGSWSIAHHGGPQGMGVGRAAAGGRVPGYGGGDRWPALLEGGETIVPKHLTGAVAPLMKAHGVPGFAAGGIIGSYDGNVAGLSPWVKHNDKATIRLIDQAVASATLAGIRAAARTAAASGSGALGGDAAANAALARRMFPQWGSGANWAAWNFVALAESGWNRFARNPSSGAYGIPQALPPTKLPFAGQAAGGSHAGPQIGWMGQYMQSVYGGPLGAAAHEAAFRWYDKGGWLPPGLSLALNTTGRPERVGGGGGTPARRHGSGPLFTINGGVNIREETDIPAVAARMSFLMTAAGLGS